MSTYYDEYRNSYYNPDDVEEQPGDNQNWKMIQKGFYDGEAAIEDFKYTAISQLTRNASELTIPAGGRVSFGVSVADDATLFDGITPDTYIADLLSGIMGYDSLVLHPFFRYTYNNVKYEFNYVNRLMFTATERSFGFYVTNMSGEEIVVPADKLIGRLNFKKIVRVD